MYGGRILWYKMLKMQLMKKWFPTVLSAFKGQKGRTLASMINWNSRRWFTWSTDSTLHTSFFTFLWKFLFNMLAVAALPWFTVASSMSRFEKNMDLYCENKANFYSIGLLTLNTSGQVFHSANPWLLLSQAAEGSHRSIIARRWVISENVEEMA